MMLDRRLRLEQGTDLMFDFGPANTFGTAGHCGAAVDVVGYKVYAAAYCSLGDPCSHTSTGFTLPLIDFVTDTNESGPDSAAAASRQIPTFDSVNAPTI